MRDQDALAQGNYGKSENSALFMAMFSHQLIDAIQLKDPKSRHDGGALTGVKNAFGEAGELDWKVELKRYSP